MKKVSKDPGTTIKSMLGLHKSREIDLKICRHLLGWKRIRLTKNGLVGHPPRGYGPRQVLSFADNDELVGDLIEAMKAWDTRLDFSLVERIKTKEFIAAWQYELNNKIYFPVSVTNRDKMMAILESAIGIFNYLKKLNQSRCRMWVKTPRAL